MQFTTLSLIAAALISGASAAPSPQGPHTVSPQPCGGTAWEVCIHPPGRKPIVRCPAGSPYPPSSEGFDWGYLQVLEGYTGGLKGDWGDMMAAECGDDNACWGAYMGTKRAPSCNF